MIQLLAASGMFTPLEFMASTAAALALEKTPFVNLLLLLWSISKCLSAASVASLALRHSLWPGRTTSTEPPSKIPNSFSTLLPMAGTELPGGYLEKT